MRRLRDIFAEKEFTMIAKLNMNRFLLLIFMLLNYFHVVSLSSGVPELTDRSIKTIYCELDSLKNNYEILSRAFRQLDGHQKYKIVLPSGIFYLKSSNEETHLFSLNDVGEFEIEGENTLFIIESPDKGFLKLNNCKTGKISGINIDYSTLPYTQGEIMSVNEDSLEFVFKTDDGFSSPLADNFLNSKTKWGVLFDEYKKLKTSAHNLIPTRVITRIRTGVYLVKTQPHVMKSLESGDKFAIIARYNGRPTYAINDCKDISFTNNTHYAGPAGSFGLKESSDIRIEGCNVKLKKGRRISQNADCIHVTPGRVGPTIRNCLFEGQMDDAINIKTQLLYIDEIVGPGLCLVSGRVIKGDTLDLFDPVSGRLIDSMIVMAAKVRGRNTLIEVNNEMPAIRIGRGKDKDMFFNRSMSNKGFIIENNIFRNSRRYGMLIQACDGYIGNNRFENISTAAIVLQNSAGWPEGFVPKRVLIENNSIINCGFDNTYWTELKQPAPIIIRTTTTSRKKAIWQGVQDIRLIGNIIRSNSDYDVFLYGVRSMLLKNNNQQRPGGVSVFKENCSDIIIEP